MCIFNISNLLNAVYFSYYYTNKNWKAGDVLQGVLSIIFSLNKINVFMDYHNFFAFNTFDLNTWKSYNPTRSHLSGQIKAKVFDGKRIVN